MKVERMSAQVISGLYKTLKWRTEDGRFMLYVQDKPETSELSSYLLRRLEPAAVYFAPYQKAPVAWQWHLPLPEFRKWWVVESPRVES